MLFQWNNFIRRLRSKIVISVVIRGRALYGKFRFLYIDVVWRGLSDFVLSGIYCRAFTGGLNYDNFNRSYSAFIRAVMGGVLRLPA